MGQSESSQRSSGLNEDHKKCLGLFSESELTEISETYKTICGHSKGGFSLEQLQDFIGAKLPPSMVLRLHKLLKARSDNPQGAGISHDAFVATLALLMKGTLTQESGVLFGLVADQEDGMSVRQLSELIGAMLKSYEEALKKSSRMNNWKLACTPGANQKFVDLVLTFMGSDESKRSPESPVKREEFEHWLQQTPLMQQVFADVFHLCFIGSSKAPSAGASAETDTSILHHMPSLPQCLDINWSKVTTQLDIPTLLAVNHHLPHNLHDQWRFLYSSNLHGASFATLLSHITHKGPSVLLVRDTDGCLFGGFASDSWEIGPSFVGSSRCFLFSLSPTLRIYEADGQNDHYMYLNIDQQTLPNGLGMGGQFDYCGLWLDQEFGHGHSRARPKCTTFGSPQLSSKEDFTIDVVEVWGVGPLPKKTTEEEEDDMNKRSVLDKDAAAQALLDLIGKERKSEGLREEDPMADIPEIHQLPH